MNTKQSVIQILRELNAAAVHMIGCDSHQGPTYVDMGDTSVPLPNSSPPCSCGIDDKFDKALTLLQQDVDGWVSVDQCKVGERYFVLTDSGYGIAGTWTGVRWAYVENDIEHSMAYGPTQLIMPIPSLTTINDLITHDTQEGQG